MAPVRGRFFYLGLAIAVVALGLVWRSGLLALTPGLKKYGGDALWALMIFAIVRLARPEARIWQSALVAFGVCTAVEFGQLYHAPWIDALRETRLGALALGSVFNWPDIPAYGVGVIVGAMTDWGAGSSRGRE